MAYTAMGNRYAYMNDIIDPLEVGRSIIQDGERKVSKTQGNQKLAEKFKTLGITVNTSDSLEEKIAKIKSTFEGTIFNREAKEDSKYTKWNKCHRAGIC